VLDTVWFRVESTWKGVKPPGWRKAAGKVEVGDPDEPVVKNYLSLRHLASGLVISFKENGLAWVEVSLPRLLHGHNGALIKSQKELDKAFSKLDLTLREVALIESSSKIFTRMDLVWHFPSQDRRWLEILHWATHPFGKIHDYTDSSIIWGANENQKLRIYDKQLQLNRVKGHVMRAEIQLRYKQLIKHIPVVTNEVKSLDFGELYTIYRAILNEFIGPGDFPIGDKFSVFAYLETIGVKPGGRSIIEYFMLTKADSTKRTWRRKMTESRMQIYSFNWSSLLPASAPPFAFDVLDLKSPSPTTADVVKVL
jgi:hypothetical protein